jgi:hypothetical protein
MKNGKHLLRLTAIAAVAISLSITGCDGSSSKGPPTSGGGSDTQLLRVEYGRLVDVYAYRRTNPARPSRGDTLHRSPVLVARDVVVNSFLDSDALFDASGEVRIEANYRFQPFDIGIGHDELLILWDDQVPGERERFQAALDRATRTLNELPAAYRGQNTNTRPIPLMPRNGVLKLTFSRSLNLDTAFFQANPAAVQLLEFKGDPKTSPPGQAFRPAIYRVIAQGAVLLLDTTILGGESGGGQTTTGLPQSVDRVTANIRIAIPTGGVIARQMNLSPDPVPELNGVDSFGNTAVIRDFRSGNDADGANRALQDLVPPMLVADVGMGIVAIDRQNRVLTLNKRFSRLTVRGRVPFVDGGLDQETMLPGGPPKVPTDQPLRSGDMVTQEVIDTSGRRIRIRAEVVANLDVGTVVGDTNYPSLGIATDGSDGGNATMARVRVSHLGTLDSNSNPIEFQASDLPLGADCSVRVHYYENVPYSTQYGNYVVTDNARRPAFVSVDPPPPALDANRNPVPPGTLIDPMAGIGLQFSEPMALSTVQPLDNYFLTNDTITDQNVVSLVREAKPISLSVLYTRLLDQLRDGTLLRLVPPLGHYHEKTKVEEYWFHVLLGSKGVTDLANNSLDLFDRRTQGIETFSVKYTLNASKDDNLVGYHSYRFAAPDEDGTAVGDGRTGGSIDYFGQFQMRDGFLIAAATNRFSQVADGQTLPGIRRDDKGECWYEGATPPPPGPGNVAKCAQVPPGALYLTPNMTTVNPQPPVVFTPPQGPRTFGGIVEPHNPRGSRLQMTYREDDFGLGYTDAASMMIDVDQLSWAPWNNEPVQFDLFDRYTLSLGHSDWRPDVRYEVFFPPPPAAPCCTFDCASLFSGLRQTFDNNLLQGTRVTDVVVDRGYQINPNDAFRASTGTTFVPYPRFARSYTWRDSRLVGWDMASRAATGLGGAKQPNGTYPARDRTANVSSPWIPDDLPKPNFNNTIWVMDDGDFHGDRARDHDPIALPLLVEFKVYPDDPRNGVASGVNLFHIALAGPIWPGNIWGSGYYNFLPWQGGPCAGLDWPTFRVHTSGGVDGLGNEVFIDMPRTTVALGGWIKDVGLGDPIFGRYDTKPRFGDDHTHWAQADFVRKVSMVTIGFFDSRKPNQHEIPASVTNWPGVANKNGLPDFEALGNSRSTQYAIQDMIAIMDPPLAFQPAGTTVKVEFRGAETITRSTVYDKPINDKLDQRGNLFNPSYACEAYRYASPNSGTGGTDPRVPATGLTPYVVEEKLDTIRDPATRLLPRYMNLRLIMENNTAVTPALSPALHSLGVVYRMRSKT